MNSPPPPFQGREREAPCWGRTDLFVPDVGSGGHHEEAKAICSRCDQRQECWNYAVSIRAEAGIWAGLEFPDEARRARRQAQAARDAGRADGGLPGVRTA